MASVWICMSVWFSVSVILKRVNSDADSQPNQESTCHRVYVSHFSFRERILFYSYAYTDYRNVTCTIRHMCSILLWSLRKQNKSTANRRLEYEPNNIKPNCDLCEPLNLFKPPTYHTTTSCNVCDQLMFGHHHHVVHYYIMLVSRRVAIILIHLVIY